MVQKSFSKDVVLKDVCVDIYSGEVFCFLGHNGAGKSTLLNIMSGLVKQGSGYVFYRKDDDGKAPTVGMCPQLAVLY